MYIHIYIYICTHTHVRIFILIPYIYTLGTLIIRIGNPCGVPSAEFIVQEFGSWVLGFGDQGCRGLGWG